MTHISEEDLILHYYGENAADAARRDGHLAGCDECRASYNALRLVLNAVDSAPVPERDAGYEARVWRKLAPKLARRIRWLRWFTPRWQVWTPAMAALLAVAFFAGRFSRPVEKPGLSASGAGAVRERILLVAVGDHLDRSQMILAELSNAPGGKGNIDISGERQAAEDLLNDNRLYRQTAHSTGDTSVATVLDDLERVLMEVANGPAEMPGEQFERLRQEIRDRGLLFKVRVVGSQVRQREMAPVAKENRKEGTKL